MRFKTVMLGAAAATLAAAPIVAQEASSTSATEDDGSDTLTRVIVLALIAGAIIGGIELFGDDEPASP